MKHLIILSLLFSTPAMAEQMYAYYKEPKTVEDEMAMRVIPGKIICRYTTPFKKDNDTKEITISKVIDDDKYCPLVINLSDPNKAVPEAPRKDIVEKEKNNTIY